DLLARRGRAHVVRDYKYARPTPASVEGYAPQLGAYQLAVEAAGAAAVVAELVFLRGGPVVRRLPPLDARREVAALAGARVARALVGPGGEAPRLDVLAGLAGVVEREPHLAGRERHARVGQLAVVVVAVEELRIEVEGGEERGVRLQDLERDHGLPVGLPLAQ